MSENITPFSIAAPGFYGLNLSDSPVGLAPQFALTADNCVIEKSGQIGSRKGWTKAHTASSDLGTAEVTCIGELIQNDGTSTILAAGGGYLYKLAAGSLTTLTYGGGGTAPTISDNNWKFCQLNGVAMFWQRGHDPLIYDPAVSTSTFRRLNEKTGTAGTVYQCNEAISAYGRVWAADTTTDKNTVVFSDLLAPHVYTGGTSGSLNLLQVWPSGGDEVVALAAHNNFLFIFGRYQILIYQGATDPSTMTLQDTIVGIGCIARDSVQTVGEDVWFLSDSGVRSLQRTIQEKSAPFRNISKNINEFIRDSISLSDLDSVKSGYSAVNNFYLLTLPVTNQVVCFDTRTVLEDGSARSTTWSGIYPLSFYEAKNRTFYVGEEGYVGVYSGYLDDTATYRMRYFTTWIDFGNPIQTSILKKIRLTLIGGSGQSIVFKWTYDFSTTYFSETAIVPGGAIAEYNNGYEYNNGAEYSGNLSVHTLSANGSSSGQLLQFGFEAQIANQLSIQKIDLFTKDGRL
jgi:hypothetical protein